MKGLIFGIAAVAASVAMADVQSANIVGYSNTGINKNNRMIGTSFGTIGKVGEQGIWLSQLTINGYLDSDKVKANGGPNGGFQITILNANGGTALDENNKRKVYAYYHSWQKSKTSWKNDAGWVNEGTGDDIIEGEDTDVWLPAGTGLWFYTSPAFYTEDGKGGYLESYTLGNAGEAIVDGINQELRKNNKPIAVPSSFPVYVSSLGIDGYLDSDKVKANGGPNGGFQITILNPNGGTAVDGNNKRKVYAYYHSWQKSKTAWKNDAGWVNEGTGEDMIAGEDTDVKLEIGTGLWFYTSPAFYTEDGKGGYVEKYYLTFPGMDE